MIQNICQIGIIVFSCASIWALAGKKHKLGFIFGLCGQPFYILSTWTAGLWGMFLVSIWFTTQHIRGLYLHRKSEKFQNILQKITKELCEMSKEDFDKLLQLHKDGDIAKSLLYGWNSDKGHK